MVCDRMKRFGIRKHVQLKLIEEIAGYIKENMVLEGELDQASESHDWGHQEACDEILKLLDKKKKEAEKITPIFPSMSKEEYDKANP